MYTLKGYCAGILVFQEDVAHKNLDARLTEIKDLLLEEGFRITFGYNTQTVTELCVDVYEKAKAIWRHDLSVAYKS